MTGDQELSIGQVAQRTGLSVHALRMYEREGLLTAPVRRSAAGRRIYLEDDVTWLRNCRIFRSSGMPLATIGRLAELIRKGPGNETERLALLRAHRQRIVTQVADLDQALALITDKVETYENHLARGTATQLWTGAS